MPQDYSSKAIQLAKMQNTMLEGAMKNDVAAYGGGSPSSTDMNDLKNKHDLEKGRLNSVGGGALSNSEMKRSGQEYSPQIQNILERRKQRRNPQGDGRIPYTGNFYSGMSPNSFYSPEEIRRGRDQEDLRERRRQRYNEEVDRQRYRSPLGPMTERELEDEMRWKNKQIQEEQMRNNLNYKPNIPSKQQMEAEQDKMEMYRQKLEREKEMREEEDRLFHNEMIMKQDKVFSPSEIMEMEKASLEEGERNKNLVNDEAFDQYMKNQYGSDNYTYSVPKKRKSYYSDGLESDAVKMKPYEDARLKIKMDSSGNPENIRGPLIREDRNFTDVDTGEAVTGIASVLENELGFSEDKIRKMFNKFLKG